MMFDKIYFRVSHHKNYYLFDIFYNGWKWGDNCLDISMIILKVRFNLTLGTY